MEKMYNKKSFLFILILFIISVLFVLIMSYSTSPLYPYYFGGDSAQFQTIGKGWSMGMIPYKNMFDHKGPIIFFVDMLGFLLTGTSFGIMLLQIIFMFFTLFSLFLLSQLCFKNHIGWGIVCIFLALIILTLYYNGGNTVEEYCLPFIGISLFFQLKYFYSNKYDTHFPLYAGFYGITFAVCLFTRITNGVAIFCGIFVITIMLLINKSWKSLLQNILCFIAGALVVILPFCIYFGFYGVLKDLFFASITYNLEYQSHMESWILSPTGEEFKTWVIQYFSAYSIFITACLSYKRNKKVFSAFCIIAGLSELYIFLSWGGEGTKFEVTASDSLVESLEELAWLARRERLSSELVYEEITADEVPSILESASFTADGDEIVSTEEIWVRIPREGDTEAATTLSEYCDICAYIEGEDAYIAIQSMTETEHWNVWRIPGYGDWMNKSFMIFIAYHTGLL